VDVAIQCWLPRSTPSAVCTGVGPQAPTLDRLRSSSRVFGRQALMIAK
jgi:hypothetical protein